MIVIRPSPPARRRSDERVRLRPCFASEVAPFFAPLFASEGRSCSRSLRLWPSLIRVVCPRSPSGTLRELFRGGKACSIAHCLRPSVLSGCQSVAIYRSMLKRHLPAGFVVPAQPVEREKPPTGAEWIHEIKHDGYRMIVHKEGENVRLYSCNAIDWTARLPAIAAGAALLKTKSLTIDGEAVVAGPDGLTDFEALA